jgi:hypothetical protein
MGSYSQLRFCFNHVSTLFECQTCHGQLGHEIQKKFAPLGWCIMCRKLSENGVITSITKIMKSFLKYGVDKLTANGSVVVHNQIIKILIFIYNVIKQKILEKC